MLPEVARRLGTELVIPADHEVGNAVGAVTRMVEESIEMLVQPAAGSRLSDPACTVFSKLGRFYIASYSEGVDYAIRTGSDHVRELAERAGASDVRIEVERRESSVTVGSEHNISEISELILVITAVGRPAIRSIKV